MRGQMRCWQLGILLGLASLFAGRGSGAELPPKPVPSRYIPGQSVSRSQLKQFYETWINVYAEPNASGVSPILARWNASLHTELQPALAEIYSNPNTRYFYGEFDDPSERAKSIDGGAGLRLIAQLLVKTSQGPRLIASITFWDYNLKRRLPHQ